MFCRGLLVRQKVFIHSWWLPTLLSVIKTMEIFHWTPWNVVKNKVEEFTKMGYMLFSIPNANWKLSNPHLLLTRVSCSEGERLSTVACQLDRKCWSGFFSCLNTFFQVPVTGDSLCPLKSPPTYMCWVTQGIQNLSSETTDQLVPKGVLLWAPKTLVDECWQSR